MCPEQIVVKPQERRNKFRLFQHLCIELCIGQGNSIIWWLASDGSCVLNDRLVCVTSHGRIIYLVQHTTACAKCRQHVRSESRVTSPLWGGSVPSAASSITQAGMGRERKRVEVRKMSHKKSVPSFPHLLIAPERGFRRPLLCMRSTCLLSHSKAFDSVLRH